MTTDQRLFISSRMFLILSHLSTVDWWQDKRGVADDAHGCFFYLLCDLMERSVICYSSGGDCSSLVNRKMDAFRFPAAIRVVPVQDEISFSGLFPLFFRDYNDIRPPAKTQSILFALLAFITTAF
ncbi:hypothetical protein GWI33_011780 [Rhynchophorus ferrugineus]|uniref:Uncharacterized protein n=1 Tax=Rhynchophorus ferrugineus TaxID=354439 RepID=A0A834I7H3_RHYFE|nr:hypothetical protein GWI33_011780 [Rhynchophorus ferrugineus]